MAEKINIPSNTPICDIKGNVSIEWRLWFNKIYNRTGGAEAMSNSELYEKIQETLTNIDALNIRVDTVESDIDTVKQEVDLLNLNIQNLDTRVDSVEDDISDLSSRLDTDESNINSLSGRVTTNEGSITSLGNRVTTNETSINTLNTNIASLNTNTIQTITNVGTGTGLYKNKNANNANLISLKAGTNVTFDTTDPNTLVISSSGSGGGGGGGTGAPANQDVFIAVNGQSSFTLTVANTAISIVTINGLQQNPSIDYSISGTTLIFNYALSAADEVVVTYNISGGASSGGATTIPYYQDLTKIIYLIKFGFSISSSSSILINGMIGSGAGPWTSVNPQVVNSSFTQYYGQNYGKWGRIGKMQLTSINLGIASYYNGSYQFVLDSLKRQYFHFSFGVCTTDPGGTTKTYSTANSAGFFGATQSVTNPILSNIWATMPYGIGIGWGTNDTNLSIYYTGSVSNTPIIINLGADFPRPDETAGVLSYYDVIMGFGNGSNTNVSIDIYRRDVAKTFSGNYAPYLFNNTSNIYAIQWCCPILCIKQSVTSSVANRVAIANIAVYDWVD